MAVFKDEWLVGTVERLIGAEKLAGLRESEGVKESLWETVVSSQLVNDDELLEALAARFHVKLADLSEGGDEGSTLVPEQVARRYHVAPLTFTDSYLEIASANPFDIDCEKTLAFATGREVRVLLASPDHIATKLDELYQAESVLDKLLEGMGIGDLDVQQIEDGITAEELAAAEEEASRRPIVKMVDLILSEGVLSRTSDIHIEPEEGRIAVRYRIDGVLRQVMQIPRNAGLPLISRIKVMAGLDIADRLRPQDGRASVAVSGARVDLRVSTLPASNGEKIVIRILDSSRSVLELSSLGLHKEEVKQIKELLEFRDGVILVTGPTGSGKTTTLYSAINEVRDEGVNIVTVEDPVEYKLEGIVQVQVHEKAGLTFAAALRSILRQDPDVVLVGEIRDKETGQTAVQASLTGHLVLSTLHTADAPNAVTRLVDLGIEAFKVGSALRGVVAQRLMRTLCSNCKVERTDPLPPYTDEWIPEGTKLLAPTGCPECATTGFKGRVSIVEILKVSPEVERLINLGETADVIGEAARAGGMKDLWQSGLGHVISGNSTIEELMRVVDMPRKDGVTTQSLKSELEGAASAMAEPPTGIQVSGAFPDLVRQVSGELELLEPLQQGEGESTDKGCRVLLVDDEDPLRKVMKDLLERDGYTVFEAADGAEALVQVDKHAPDVIVLDLNLPGLDGYGVIGQLRSRAETQHVPILVLTAKSDEDNEVRVFELGATDFLTKPFRARALSARIQSALVRSKR